ncbi:MAG TPA: glycosyltransferase family A protein [Candidatus Angelobacter sp.]
MRASMSTGEDSVTVITLTRGRPHLLRRAIASVAQQDFPGPIEHLILIDDCPATRLWCARHASGLEIKWHYMTRSGRVLVTPKRLAELRNEGVRLAGSRWIMFLDDDNQLEPNHLSSLVALARISRCQAVHSHAQLLWPDGTPYVDPILPWGPRRSARKAYRNLCARGIFVPGSHIARDRASAETVDTGEWLFSRSLLIQVPFPVHYTASDKSQRTTEDTKLLRRLLQRGVQIRCTELPTLKYYLGGYSNEHATVRQGTEAKRPGI